MLTLYFEINRYSHYFSLTRVTPAGRPMIEDFGRKYVQYGLAKQGRQFVRAPIKVFGARTIDRKEYRFHHYQFDHFLRHLKYHNTPEHAYTITDHTADTGIDIDIDLLPGWNPRPIQIPAIEYIVSDQPTKQKLLELQTGSGKALSDDSLVKIPGGWCRIDDILVGDIVTGYRGEQVRVRGVYPQGDIQLYTVTFGDGRSVEACADHLWKVYYVNTSVHKRWLLINTAEMLRLISMPNPQVYIELCHSEQGDDVALPIPPYSMGVLLGDGGLTANNVAVTKGDAKIFDRMEREFPEGLKWSDRNGLTKTIMSDWKSGTNTYRTALRELGLMEKKSFEKFVPAQYLYASTAQRLALVQGLLDTDGTVSNPGGTVGFSTTSEQLAKDMQYLIRSLGGIAAIANKQTSYTYKGEKKLGRPAFQVNIRFKKPSDLFSLSRKKELTIDDGQYNDSLKLRVKSIVPSRVAPATCIEVDGTDKLFVTNDFIVTHNTFMATSGVAKLKKRFLVIIKATYVEKWISDLEELCGIGADEILVIQGGAGLIKTLIAQQEGKLDVKAIILSSRTLQNWYSLYEKVGKDEILNMGYPCLPDQLFEHLGIGIRLMDEVHLMFHLNFKIDLYTHVDRSISLSATMISDDSFLNQMYEIAFPKFMRFGGFTYDKYIHAYSWSYRIRYPNKIQTTEYGSTTYSHHAFEKSIIKNKDILDDYLAMIGNCILQMYLPKYQPGDRLLIYCASVHLCTILTQHLSRLLPDRNIKRYVEEDPYSDLMTADITVSTLLSAGTGVDIDQLTTVILTTAVSSTQSNIQGFGRLRKIPNKKLQFIFFSCLDIPKHVEYSKKKTEILRDRALEFQPMNYHSLIG